MTTTLAEPRRAYEPPANTEHEGDWRWYVHPLSAERFVSVTTALSVATSDAIKFWATGLSAQAAFVELPKLVAATIRPLCGRSHNRCDHDRQDRCDRCPCQECRDCVQVWIARRHFAETSRRSDEGRRMHKAIEWWALHDGQWPTVEPDLEPYVVQFRRFVQEYGLTPDSWELSEATVLNREHGYAGTLDGHVRVRSGVTEPADDFCARLDHPGGDVLVGFDAKTKEKEGDTRVWPDHAMQLTAYRRGEVVMLPDGAEYPLPATDAAAVLQLRPDGYQFKPVQTNDRVFVSFLNALGLFQALADEGNSWTSSRSFPLPEQYKRDKANRKARERRAAAKKQAGVPREQPDGSVVHVCVKCQQPVSDADTPDDTCAGCGNRLGSPAGGKKTTKRAAGKKAPAKKTPAKAQPATQELRPPGIRDQLAQPKSVTTQVDDPFAVVDQPQEFPF